MRHYQNISQVFIFAAGRGERMRPITDNIPKPLVKVWDKSIIDYSLEKLLQKDQFKKIIINGFYLANQIKNHIKNIGDDRIFFSQEIEKIETGGGLLFAKDHIDFNSPLLIINGDIVWEDIDDDITLICKEYLKGNSDFLMGLKKKEDYFGYESDIGDFDMDQNGNLVKYSDKKMDYAFVGIAVINPKILLEDFIEDFGKCFSMSKIYKRLINENSNIKRIKGMELRGTYFHIGTIDSLEKINN
ncbi:MAG: hypothetical protein ISQ34_02965 [Rickettsiales bacterium]|nr:hypothetical protein [Rickettsiales bacterium]